MYCKNCGKNLNPGENFCSGCGTKFENQTNTIINSNVIQNNYTQTSDNINTLNNNVNQIQVSNGSSYGMSGPNLVQMNNTYQQLANSSQQLAKPKKNKTMRILTIVGVIIGVFVVLFIVIFLIASNTSDKLICKSDEANITITFSESGIKGYKATGLSYDLDVQKEYAKSVGIDAYIKEFNNWFISNTSGSCTINGKVISEENDDNNMIVGDNRYGYITVPKNWAKFYDVDGNTSLQYSYANIYIVSLNYLEDSQHTAKEYASNYMYNMKQSNEVTGVTGATVKIGKNKEYTAYQVYMYYPYDSVYLVTYWFEAEDGMVRYIALEGPEESNGVKITDYLYIAESFSLTK